MGKEKSPITDEEFDRVVQAAYRKDEKSGGRKYRTADGVGQIGECEIVVLILRYTGMHVSVLSSPSKYNLRVEGDYIMWNRPKKKGKVAHTEIKISKHLNFNVSTYINDLKKRRRRISRQYFHALVRDIGEKARVYGLSPMTFRHTFGVALLDAGCSEAFVRQKLNCSRRVVSTYLKYSKKRADSVWERIDW